MLKIYNVHTKETLALLNEHTAVIDLVERIIKGSSFKMVGFNKSALEFSIIDNEETVYLGKTKEYLISLIKKVSGLILSRSDWKIAKQFENSCYTDAYFAKVKEMRAHIREWSDSRELEIKSAATLEALNAVDLTYNISKMDTYYAHPYIGSFTVSSAEDLDKLENYTSVTGDLSIVTTGIKSLGKLSSLRKVGGDLLISGGDKLTCIQGLENLLSVGSVFRISSTPNVTKSDYEPVVNKLKEDFGWRGELIVE